MVAIAHDTAIATHVPTIDQPGKERSAMNDWRRQGLKELCRWDFLNELPRDGSPGRPKMADGYQCAGQKYFYDSEYMTLYIE
jgi:hypothetical protein